MPANQLPVVTDSFVDVSIDIFERSLDLTALSPALARLSELAVAGGTHYLQLPEYLGSASMLATDFEPQLTSGLHLREAIITKGSETSHYVFDVANDRTMLIKAEVPVKPGTTQAAFSPDMPPILVPLSDTCKVVNRVSGRNYDRRALTRALHLHLVDSDEYADQFLKDTKPFLDSVWVRTQPTVNAQKQ